MYKLSPSSINLMLECKKCFWLQIIKKISRPAGIFPSLPSGMDKILKEHFDRFMEKNELPPELKSSNINDYKLFNDKEKLKVWRNNRQGLEYIDKRKGILLHGAVDNLLVKGSKLIVLDYKTRGFPLKEDTHEHYQVQMNMYNFLLRKNGYETEDYSYLLFYYPNKVTGTGEVLFDTKLIKLPTSAENGEKVFENAVNILETQEVPNSSQECGFCKWKKEN
ncbi:PD-(D/E)XK nuclease family protein [Candidatus Woesearchaeota archaeon]|nr:PD-(D/E)XK nuclease family protein [Candidatus Woesearchaeota archaeon]